MNFKSKLSKLLLFIIILIILSVVILSFKNSSNKDILIKRTSTYNIYLNSNNFYQNNPLKNPDAVVTNAIKNIELNFNYEINNAKNIKDLSYSITSSLTSTHNDDPESIWTKDFTLKEEQKLTNLTSFNTSINIDYNYYKNLVKSYEKYYNIKVSSNLYVSLNINYTLNNKKYEDKIDLTIPINLATTKITKNYNENSIITLNTFKPNYFIILFIIILATIIIYKILPNKKKNQYTQTLSQILKEYNDLIITIKNIPNIKDLKPMYLTNISDLITLAKINNTNIIYDEKIKGEKSTFYIIKDNYIYIYSLINKKNQE